VYSKNWVFGSSGSRTFSHRFPSPSHRQQSALISWWWRASSFLVLPKNFFYSHWRKTLSRQGFRLRASEIKKAAGLRLAPFGWGPPRGGRVGLDFWVSKAVNVSAIPIRLVNPLLFFFLSSSSLPLLYFRGAENTYHSINKKKKVAIQFQMVWAWKQPAIYR